MDAEKQMEELRTTIADICGCYPEWPDHGNVPLAIAATVALLVADKQRLEEKVSELTKQNEKLTTDLKDLQQAIVGASEHNALQAAECMRSELERERQTNEEFNKVILTSWLEIPRSIREESVWKSDILKHPLPSAIAILLKQINDFKAEVEKVRAEKDNAYLERNKCVALMARMALKLGLIVAVTRTDIKEWSEDWHGCVYIELPTGQVSWHFHDSQAYLFNGLPQKEHKWDEHTTPEKYDRVEAAFKW